MVMVLDIGPVELLLIQFPGNQFNGDVAPALKELVDRDEVRVIDLVFVTKDADGEVVGLEVGDVDDAVGAAFGVFLDDPAGLIGDEDIADLAESLEPESSAAILLFEHVWAKRFQQAVIASGGVLVESIRIPYQVVQEVAAARA